MDEDEEEEATSMNPEGPADQREAAREAALQGQREWRTLLRDPALQRVKTTNGNLCENGDGRTSWMARQESVLRLVRRGLSTSKLRGKTDGRRQKPSTGLLCEVSTSITSRASSPEAGEGAEGAPSPPQVCPAAAAAAALPADLLRHHTHAVAPEQVCSAAVQTIDAPLEAVWSVVRRFDRPHEYKKFLKGCHVILGDGRSVGALREVAVVSGLPAGTSTERLEILDDERHVIGFSVVGGDHRLRNYRSVTTVAAGGGGGGTVVVESYVVDVPPGNTEEETRAFVDTIVKCNLQSLAEISRKNNNTSSVHEK
ncbi:abscisic acid receptor PYL4-like [Salvia hispanica]|uniref:abscisic acid receptor PYL4-like n=1 Tax=Salvia hispanica TaxID=49212 RepID=UPI002009256F|nr:abscisic acid receptor PYL4-like [Salvia hispanica]